LSATIWSSFGRHGNDRRKRYVELTAKGKSLLPRRGQLCAARRTGFERISARSWRRNCGGPLGYSNNRDLIHSRGVEIFD